MMARVSPSMMMYSVPGGSLCGRALFVAVQLVQHRTLVAIHAVSHTVHGLTQFVQFFL